MRGVCLFVLALAVVAAEEGKPPMLGPDVKLMAQCTDSLTTLMNNKAKALQGLKGITSKVADQSKPAKTKDTSKAQPAKPAAKKDEANKPAAAAAKPKELGEGGEVGSNWPGLKSMSRKDIKQFLDDVEHLAVESTTLLKAVDQSRTDIHITEPKKGEVVMLGDEAPQSTQDKAGAKADAQKAKEHHAESAGTSVRGQPHEAPHRPLRLQRGEGVGQPDCCQRVRQVPQGYQAHGRQHVAKCERVCRAEAVDYCRTETEKGQHRGQGQGQGCCQGGGQEGCRSEKGDKACRERKGRPE